MAQYVFYINNKFVQVPGSPLLCEGESMPETDCDWCAPNVRTSEIRRIFLQLTSADDFEDWTQPFEWVTRLSETSHDRNAIRPISVVGDKPAPNATNVRISLDRTQTVQKEHTVNATMYEVNDTNHAFVMAIKNGRYLKMHYETTGGYMFGGNGGIMARVTVNMILPKGQGEIMMYQVTITWNSLRTEDRCLSPIFDEPGACGLVANVHTTGITATGFDVAWDSNPLFGAYQCAITTINVPPTTGLSLVYGNSISFSYLSPNTTYYFWVRPICTTGGIGDFSTINVHTDISCAAPGDLVASNQTGTSIKFEWSGELGDSFEYVLNETGITPGGSGDPVDATIVTITDLEPCTEYFFYVRKNCGAGDFSAWSHISASTGCCSAPTGISVLDIHSTYGALVWDVVNSLNQMAIVVNTTGVAPADGDGTLVDEVEGVLYLSPLTEGTHYHVFIQRVCANGVHSDWVEVEFDTVPELPVTNGLSGFYISIYGVHTSGGNNVDIWDDLSSNANNLFFSTGARAKLIPNNLATRPGVFFNATTLMRSVVNFPAMNKVHVFIVESLPAGGPANATIMEYGNADFMALVNGFRIGVTSAPLFKAEANGDVGYGKSELTTVTGTRIIHVAALDKAAGDEILTSYYAVGGTSGSTGYTGANNTNSFGAYPLYVGGNFANTQLFQGSIGCIAFYNRILSNSEITQVVNYLKIKYGF